jgi:hypothetical protein
MLVELARSVVQKLRFGLKGHQWGAENPGSIPLNVTRKVSTLLEVGKVCTRCEVSFQDGAIHFAIFCNSIVSFNSE